MPRLVNIKNGLEWNNEKMNVKDKDRDEAI